MLSRRLRAWGPETNPSGSNNLLLTEVCALILWKYSLFASSPVCTHQSALQRETHWQLLGGLLPDFSAN